MENKNEQEYKLLSEMHKLLLHAQLNGPLDSKHTEILNSRLAELLGKYSNLTETEIYNFYKNNIEKPKTSSVMLEDHSLKFDMYFYILHKK